MERAFLGETPPLTAANAAKPSAPPSLSPPDSPALTSVSPPPGDNLTHTEEKGEEKKEVCVWLVSWCLPPAVAHYPGNCTQSGPAPGGRIL